MMFHLVGNVLFVIFDTTNDERRRIEVVARSGQAGVEFPAEAMVLKEWLAVFGREHKVRVELRQGLRHRSCSRCVTPSAYGFDGGIVTMEYNRFAVKRRSDWRITASQ